jgi:L-iditol 2-dehydrogenase
MTSDAMTQIGTEQTRALLVKQGVVELEQAAVPQPGPRQVLVEVAAVGICGSDVHYFDHGRIADFIVKEPLVLGHEASGTIRAVGSEVTDRQAGQRVAMEPQETCGRCTQCLAGRYNLCPDVEFFATPPVHGAFAQYVVLEAHRAHPVPDSMSDEAAALIEPLAVGVWANQKAAVQPGDRVLVTNQFRLDTAAQRWANQVINALAGPLHEQVEPVNVILECSGATPAVQAAFAAAAPAARVILVGMGSPDMELPVAQIQIKELIVTGTFRYANSYPAAIALAASGAVDLDGLVTGQYGLAQAAEALQVAKKDSTTLKPIVYPGR